MFFTYVRRELRRRMHQVAFIALGVGLVITVVAAAGFD
jgi:hypothetical protein